MKKRIAVFRHDLHNYICITEDWADPDNWKGLNSGYCPYTRLTEYVDVDFPEIIEPALDHSEYNYE